MIFFGSRPGALLEHEQTHLLNVVFPETASGVESRKSGQPGFGAEGYLPPLRLHLRTQGGWLAGLTPRRDLGDLRLGLSFFFVEASSPPNIDLWDLWSLFLPSRAGWVLGVW